MNEERDDRGRLVSVVVDGQRFHRAPVAIEKRSDDELCRLAELAGKALPGPYTVSDEVLGAYFIRASDGSLVETFYTGIEQARFVAAACSLAPSLVAEVRSLRGVVQAVEALRDKWRQRAKQSGLAVDYHYADEVAAALAAAADAPQPATCDHGKTKAHQMTDILGVYANCPGPVSHE